MASAEVEAGRPPARAAVTARAVSRALARAARLIYILCTTICETTQMQRDSTKNAYLEIRCMCKPSHTTGFSCARCVYVFDRNCVGVFTSYSHTVRCTLTHAHAHMNSCGCNACCTLGSQALGRFVSAGKLLVRALQLVPDDAVNSSVHVSSSPRVFKCVCAHTFHATFVIVLFSRIYILLLFSLPL